MVFIQLLILELSLPILEWFPQLLENISLFNIDDASHQKGELCGPGGGALNFFLIGMCGPDFQTRGPGSGLVSG